MRAALSITFLVVGLLLVVAAVLLLLLADLPAPVAAAMGVPGLGFLAASSIVATSRRSQG